MHFNIEPLYFTRSFFEFKEKAKFEKLNTAIRNKVAKLEKMSAKDRAQSPDLAVVKQIINKPEVKKLFKSKGINVMDLVSSIIG